VKKRLLSGVSLIVLLLFLVFPLSAIQADDEGIVSCTVTAQIVSLTISNTSIDYGVVGLGESVTTLANGPIVVTNSGTVDENFMINSSNASRLGGTDWILKESQGVDQFVHSYNNDGGSNWYPLTNSDTAFALKTTPLGSMNLYFKLKMPTEVTDANQHSFSVTITAEASD
jgi:hypothetical protein